jgi:serine/threonine protein kinase
MQYLHDPLIGIIHGDIKGLNMLLMRDGSTKVTRAFYCGLTVRELHLMSSPQFCDFGGAVQVLTTASSMSSAGSATQAATKAYEAPERFKGEPKSTATDVYAFGVLMWEFSTCEVPFVDHPGLIDTLVLRGVRPPIPSPLPEGFPADYFALMQECWSDNPAQRPTAENVNRRLLKMDPSARAVQGPLTLWHPARTHAPASLLHCIMAAMQATPGQPNAHLARVITANVADAALIVSGSARVQLLMRQHQLTELEAQAVSAYTTDARDHGGLREHSIFFVYNAAIRSANPQDVELWSEFSFLFCTALDKLPAVAKTVFRGLDVPLTQLSHQYVANGTIWLTSMTSTTTDKAKTLLQFGAGASGRPGTLLHINAVDAKDISDFSKHKTENEYVIPPNSCHTVKVALSSAQVNRFPLNCMRLFCTVVLTTCILGCRAQRIWRPPQRC